jgi:AraC-like DNA-binding protein
MQEKFNQNIIYITSENVKTHKFPDRFSNEIYYSNQKNENVEYNIGYVSPFTIKYTVEEYECYNINGRLRKINANKMIIVNSGSEIVNTTSFGSAFSIFLDEITLKECHNDLINSNGFLLQKPLDIHYIIPEFCDIIQSPSPHINFVLNKLLYAIKNNRDVILTSDFYYELAEKIISSQNQKLKEAHLIGVSKLSTKIELFKRVDAAKEYLNDTLDSSFNLDELSKVCYMSKYNLIRTFKKVNNITPHRYFLIQKINKAKELLKNKKDMNITDIAFQLGYSNIHSFSRQFRCITGKSPSQIRQ